MKKSAQTKQLCNFKPKVKWVKRACCFAKIECKEGKQIISWYEIKPNL